MRRVSTVDAAKGNRNLAFACSYARMLVCSYADFLSCDWATIQLPLRLMDELLQEPLCGPTLATPSKWTPSPASVGLRNYVIRRAFVTPVVCISALIGFYIGQITRQHLVRRLRSAVAIEQVSMIGKACLLPVVTSYLFLPRALMPWLFINLLTQLLPTATPRTNNSLFIRCKHMSTEPQP